MPRHSRCHVRMDALNHNFRSSGVAEVTAAELAICFRIASVDAHCMIANLLVLDLQRFPCSWLCGKLQRGHRVLRICCVSIRPRRSNVHICLRFLVLLCALLDSERVARSRASKNALAGSCIAACLVPCVRHRNCAGAGVCCPCGSARRRPRFSQSHATRCRM